MPNDPRIAKQDRPASFLSQLAPERRRFLQEQIDPAQFAELQRAAELRDAATELQLEQRAKRPLLPPVQRRVPRERPRTPKAPPDFYRLKALTPALACRQFKRHPNRTAIAALRRAAFSGRRGWPSAVSMGVIRQGLALLMLADQRGVVRDVPLKLLRHVHRDRRTGRLPCLDTIGGGYHHPDGDLENAQCGYNMLLELAGFMSAKQYRKRNPSRPDIAPSCNFYTLCEPTIPIAECETQEECERTLAILELAKIPHPDSGVHPRPPPHPPP